MRRITALMLVLILAAVMIPSVKVQAAQPVHFLVISVIFIPYFPLHFFYGEGFNQIIFRFLLILQNLSINRLVIHKRILHRYIQGVVTLQGKMAKERLYPRRLRCACNCNKRLIKDDRKRRSVEGGGDHHFRICKQIEKFLRRGIKNGLICKATASAAERDKNQG